MSPASNISNFTLGRFARLLLLMAAITSLTLPGISLAFDWFASTADDGSNDRGRFVSMVRGLDGIYHAAYYRFDSITVGPRNLIYASKTDPLSGGNWSTLIVDSQPSVGTEASIALDGAGNPHISYYESEFANLKHAWWNGGSWQTEFVDVAGIVGQFSSVSVDFFGKVYVAYFDASTPALKLASKAPGGTWEYSLIDTAGTVGLYVEMAPLGSQKIAYYDLTKRNLKFAEQIAGEWTITTVDSIGDVGRFISMTFSGLGEPFIAYYDVSNQDLKLAERPLGGGWQFTTVASAGDVGAGTSIALRGDDLPHIAYYDADLGDLRIAGRTGTGEWYFDDVATDGEVGRFSAIVIPEDKLPKILYYNETDGQLEFTAGSGSVTGIGDDAPLPLPKPLTLRIAPNPVRVAGVLTVDLPEPDDAQLHIYDIRGRLVRRVFDGRLEAGPQAISWDGRDELGRAVPSGKYLAMARTGREKATAGLVVIH